jgi:hypothetical protein
MPLLPVSDTGVIWFSGITRGGNAMAEILGLGVTHSPLLVGSDERMAGIFERVLNSPKLPAAARDPANWPLRMCQEWAEHQSAEAAAAHRQRAAEGFRAVRAPLDTFNPDFVLIWGDDQYENFREDGVAPFCVFALDTIDSKTSRYRRRP